MQSKVCSPCPSQPANIPTSGQVRRTTKILADCQWSHLCTVANNVFDGPVIQLPEVNAEPQAAVLLLDQDHCTHPWTVQFSDGTNVQHLLEMGLHIIIHARVYVLVALLEGHPICYLNLVFN